MRAMVAVFLLMASSLPASSQQLMKGEVKVTPLSSGGVPIGCSLEYTLIISDRVYRNGGPVGITGTFAWLAGRDRVGLAGMFKLGVADFDQFMKPSPSKPHSTVLRVGGRLQTPQMPMPCEDRNYVCGAYSTEGALRVFSAILEKPVEVGYNRRDGGFDVMVSLPVTASERDSLVDCMYEFMGSLEPVIQDKAKKQ